MSRGFATLEDEEKQREIRHRELKAVVQQGTDSEDAGSIDEVVARNRARRANRNARTSSASGRDKPLDITNFIAARNVSCMECAASNGQALKDADDVS